jgi:hypothetical protein
MVNSVVALKKFTLSRLVIQCAVLLFVPLYALAQQATIVGTATDPTGAVVQNVTIVATSNETGQSHTTTTNEAGQYVVPDLQIGHYNFKATASGFKVAEQKDVLLNVGDRLRVDFKMVMGTASESVTVEANAVKVQTDTGEVSNVISGRQITQLATNGRSIYTLISGAAALRTTYDLVLQLSSVSNLNVLAHPLAILRRTA